jgi:mono/diheme cytochrome c family protein
MRAQIEIIISTVLLAATAIILIVLGLNENDRMQEFERHQEAQTIEVGAELFEINCRGCHGLRGEGIPGLAPPLNDAHFFTRRLEEVGWQGTLGDYTVATISTGRQISTRPEQYPGAGKPAMPSWSESFGGPLRDDQIEALAAFILNWEATALGEAELTVLPTPTPSAEQSDDPIVRGQNVYATNGCGACHAIDGISVGAVGPGLDQIGEIAQNRVEGQTAEEYIRQSIVNPSAFLVEGYDDLMVKNLGENLSEAELEDLVAFLLAQR